MESYKCRNDVINEIVEHAKKFNEEIGQRQIFSLDDELELAVVRMLIISYSMGFASARGLTLSGVEAVYILNKVMEGSPRPVDRTEESQ